MIPTLSKLTPPLLATKYLEAIKDQVKKEVYIYVLTSTANPVPL